MSLLLNISKETEVAEEEESNYLNKVVIVGGPRILKRHLFPINSQVALEECFNLQRRDHGLFSCISNVL